MQMNVPARGDVFEAMYCGDVRFKVEVIGFDHLYIRSLIRSNKRPVEIWTKPADWNRYLAEGKLRPAK